MSTEEAKGMGESKSAAPPALDSPEPAAQTASDGESGMTSAEQTHVFADLVRKLNALEKLNLDLKRDVRAHRRVCGAGWLATCVSVAGSRHVLCRAKISRCRGSLCAERSLPESRPFCKYVVSSHAVGELSWLGSAQRALCLRIRMRNNSLTWFAIAGNRWQDIHSHRVMPGAVWLRCAVMPLFLCSRHQLHACCATTARAW